MAARKMPWIISPPKPLTPFDALRINREIEIQELQAALDVDRLGAKRLMLLRYLHQRGRLPS